MTAGDLAWGRRRGGRLTRGEELRYLVALSRALLAARRPGREGRSGRSGRPVGPRLTTPATSLADGPPDSAFARVAFETARELSPPGLLAHCVRTWLLADLRGRSDGIRHDPELLYAACLLHDLGLTEAHWCLGAECFAVDGAIAAHDLALAHGYPRAAELADAICLHLDVTVPAALGAEAHLLQAGALADLVGTGPAAVPRPLQVELERRHPRDRLGPDVVEPVRRQAGLRPRSRIGVLERRAGFTARVR